MGWGVGKATAGGEQERGRPGQPQRGYPVRLTPPLTTGRPVLHGEGMKATATAGFSGSGWRSGRQAEGESAGGNPGGQRSPRTLPNWKRSPLSCQGGRLRFRGAAANLRSRGPWLLSGTSSMRRILSVIVLLVAPALLLADGPTLKEARQRWLRGNYDEDRELYQELAKDPKQAAAATLGISRPWESVGEYGKAYDVVTAALSDTPKDADLLARQAELLFLRGRWDDADQVVKAALDVNKEHFLARYVKAELSWGKGDLKTADADFRWFVRTYSDRSDKCMEVKDPDELLLVGRAGVANARWHNLDDQFEFVLNEVYKDALKYDKDFWPAEFQAGMLLLEKYNRAEALPAFENALKINPRAAEVLAGKAALALQQYETKDAELFLDQALAINPNLPEALQLRADLFLLAGDYAGALKELDRARKVSPRDES